MRHHFKTVAILGAYAFGFCFWSFVNASGVVTYTAEESEPPQQPEEIEKIILIATTTPHEFVRAEVSAYTSSVEETDSTPEINAMGTKPTHGSIACPTRYEFGTEVIVNGKSYFCDDRMGPRFSRGDYFDIWMSSRDEAMHWGRRHMTVEVVQ